MMARIVSQMLTLLILFQAGNVALSATINGGCDLCSLNDQLLEKVNDLNKGQSAIKGLIGQIIKPGEKRLKLSSASITQTNNQTNKRSAGETISTATPKLYFRTLSLSPMCNQIPISSVCGIEFCFWLSRDITKSKVD